MDPSTLQEVRPVLPSWAVLALGLTLGTLAWVLLVLLGLRLELVIIIGPGLLRFGAEWWFNRGRW